jgi:hypothetical protein
VFHVKRRCLAPADSRSPAVGRNGLASPHLARSTSCCNSPRSPRELWPARSSATLREPVPVKRARGWARRTPELRRPATPGDERTARCVPADAPKTDVFT